MHLPHHRSILETTTQRGYGNQRGSSTIQSEAYHGENAESGYAQAIFDLLRAPVTLGMRGVGSNYGHQR